MTLSFTEHEFSFCYAIYTIHAELGFAFKFASQKGNAFHIHPALPALQLFYNFLYRQHPNLSAPKGIPYFFLSKRKHSWELELILGGA